jgi:tRNA-Thr(GGU) m(6)t(6)A37 methyltransferase TsaA
MLMRPVAVLRTCYPGKFGVPRQSGLAPAARGLVEFEPAYRRAEAVEGLEGFTHLWLITRFHLVPDDATKLSVRPPRLGGNERVGVFATRSPFRPNRIGLSVVRLERVESESGQGPRLHVSGVDLVDGTPVLDIKPYIRYADSVPDAASGFANEAPRGAPVRWLAQPPPSDEARRVIEQSLALRPEPAYLASADDREFGGEIAGFRLRWRIEDDLVTITVCEPWPL